MIKIFAIIIFILMTPCAAAQANSPEVDEGIASIKQEKFDFGAESRIFIEEAAPEFLLKYKNISADLIHDDENFLKLKADKEIFSLMGTGLEWSVALNSVAEKVLPSVGINLYARIRPRLDFYMQFSGLTLGRHGHISDFESGLKYFPQKNFSVSAGWREINFKRHENFNLRGIFAGVRYDF